MTAVPATATIVNGTLSAGSGANLAANDDITYEVNSATLFLQPRTTAWYGTFTGVSNGLSNLKVTYSGSNSRSCTQTIALWRWTDSIWVQLDSRLVDTTETLIANLTAGGTLGDYVSGTTGDGDLRVRIRCQTTAGIFVSSGDLLRVTYDRPN